jgi:hypothetical protein
LAPALTSASTPGEPSAFITTTDQSRSRAGGAGAAAPGASRWSTTGGPSPKSVTTARSTPRR